MEMIIAVIVLAAATTVNFMSFVTLKKQIEANRVEISMENDEVKKLIEIRSNKIEKEVQEGRNSTIQGLGAVATIANHIKDEVKVNSEVIAAQSELNKQYIGKGVADIIKEVQEGNNFGEKAIGLLSCNISELGETIKSKVSESTEQINGVVMRESAKNIYLHIRGTK